MNSSVIVPLPNKRSGVYILRHGGIVVYVGTSKGVVTRLAGHRGKKYNELEIIWCSDRNRISLERRLIDQFNPRYNLDPSLDHFGGTQVRISLANEEALLKLVGDAKLDFINVSKAANLAIEKGLPILRKLLVSSRKPRKP